MALIFPHATERQIKQLAKTLQTQLVRLRSAPVSLHEAQEAAAQSLGHASFHAALTFAGTQSLKVEADASEPSLDTLVRRYVPLWHDDTRVVSVGSRPILAAAMEGPLQWGQTIRFRDVYGVVHERAAWKAGETPALGVRADQPPTILPPDEAPFHRFGGPNTATAWTLPHPSEKEARAKESVWAGQLGLRMGAGLMGEPEVIIAGLAQGVALLPPNIDRIPKDAAFARALLKRVVPALCWLRDQPYGVPITREHLSEQLDVDYLSDLIEEVEAFPEHLYQLLAPALTVEHRQDFRWAAGVIHTSLQEVDLGRRDRQLQQRRSMAAVQEKPSRRRMAARRR